MNKTPLLAALVSAALAAPAVASAQAYHNFLAPHPSGILAPGTRRGWFTAGMGGLVNFDSGAVGFRANESVGFRFFNQSAGPGLSLELDESVVSGLFAFTSGARFSWAIQLTPNHGLYLTPYVGPGFTLVTGGQGIVAAFNAQTGLDFQVILGDRGLLWARPFGLEVLVGASDRALVNYTFGAGGGVTF